MEKLCIDKRVLASSSHVVLIDSLLRRGLSCHIPTSHGLGEIAGLAAPLHCKSVDNYFHIAAQAPTVTRGAMCS